MAILRVQGPARGTTTSATLTAIMALTPTNGNLLIACIGTYQGTSGQHAMASSIIQTNVTWTPQITNSTNSYFGSEIWVGVVGSGASTSITINLSQSALNGATVDICEYSGLLTSGFLDYTAKAQSSGTSASTGTTATTTQPNELWIGCTVTAAVTQSSNNFILLDGVTANSLSVAYLEYFVNETGAANANTTWSGTHNNSGCIATFIGSSVPTGPIIRVQGPARASAYQASDVIALGLAPTQGNVLICVVGGYDASEAGVTSISQTGVTWTLVISSETAHPGGGFVQIWQGIVGYGALATATLIYDNNNYLIADICEYSGLLTVGNVDQTASKAGSGTSTSTGTTATTTQNNELLIGGIFIGGQTGAVQSAPTNIFVLLDGMITSEWSTAYLEKIVASTGTALSGTTLGTSTFYYGCIATFIAPTYRSVLTDLLGLSGSKVGKAKINSIDKIGLLDGVIKKPKVNSIDKLGLLDAITKKPKVNSVDKLGLADSEVKKSKVNSIDKLGLADSLTKKAKSLKSDMLGLNDSVTRKTRVFKADLLGYADSLTKKSRSVHADFQAYSDSIKKSVKQTKIDVLALSDSIQKKIRKVSIDSQAFADVLTKKTKVVRADIIGFFDRLLAGKLHTRKVTLQGSKGEVTLQGSKGEVTLQGDSDN